MRLAFYFLILLLAQHPLWAQNTSKPKRHFTETPQPPKPDYANPDHWAALPTKKDPADVHLSQYPENQEWAKADVFFVHPTTFTGEATDSFEWNADVNNAKLNRIVDNRPIKYQASVFNSQCKVYAPRYRQAHYYTFLTQNTQDHNMALALAYEDIKASFEYYLAHYNQGRPIVIASHSQGTIHAQHLIRDFFENKPLDSLLIAAYLVGMPIPIDSLPTISPCEDKSQTGCFVSWRTYERGFDGNWGKGDFVCHNPISWNMDTAYVPKSEQLGAVIRKFNRPLVAICDAQVHQEILWVTKPRFPGSRLVHTHNFHVGDYNLFYLDVRKNVEDRVSAWFALREQ